ncbi:hypothetical protein E1B06_14965 [Brevibacillus laterosporus]|uniref:BC1872 family protein n=1 Tax=Brevibacillus laterosporus TaxID=1465 RepID=UPI00240542CA|nr:hypothetical protein [Brevibacillus laterosporus]MDF9412984.1 hypothetical protein [Brevibacillus laterosporus]
MTEQQIIETLATKVMGWVPIPPRPNGPPEVFPAFCFPIYGDIKDGCIVAHKDADGVIDTAHWNPIQNIADAWMVVEKFKNGDPILRARFAALLPVLIYEIEPKDICKAAMEVVAEHYGN